MVFEVYCEHLYGVVWNEVGDVDCYFVVEAVQVFGDGLLVLVETCWIVVLGCELVVQRCEHLFGDWGEAQFVLFEYVECDVLYDFCFMLWVGEQLDVGVGVHVDEVWVYYELVCVDTLDGRFVV